MRILLIDPTKCKVEEREIAAGRKRLERLLGGVAAFATWLNGEAVYSAEWPSDGPCFRIHDAGWISGPAVVLGAAAGPSGWRAPSKLSIDDVVVRIDWPRDPVERPVTWLNNRWAAHLSDHEAFEAMTVRRWNRLPSGVRG
jgi:hypothetical protein